MKEAREHLDDSIRRDVPLSWLNEYLPKEESSYIAFLLRGAKGFYAWGAVPGKNNVDNWGKMSRGDIVFTVYDGRYRYVSSVICRIHSRALASKIWGFDPDGNTWEYMYVLSKPIPIDREVAASPQAGLIRKMHFGFSRVPDLKNKEILDSYGSLDSFLEKVFDVSLEQLNTPELDLEDSIGFEETDNLVDARKKVLAQIVRRQGQAQFREKLFDLYDGKCAVTGCTVFEVLEAAHIVPYMGEKSNSLSNGVILRADVHSLFDLGLIKIDRSYIIHIHESLKGSEYWCYEGSKIHLPKIRGFPDPEALDYKFGLL